MPGRPFATALLVASTLLPLRDGTAQRPGGAVLLGRVTVDSTKQVLAGASVSIPSLSLKTTSDSLGRFRFDGIPPGRRGLRVDMLGYAPLRTAIEFSTGDTVEVEIGVSPSMDRLDAIEIVATQNPSRTLFDFERRRASGTGEYLTAEDLKKFTSGRLSDALRTLRGISTITGQGGGVYAVNGRASNSRQGSCYSAVMLDGSWIYDGERWQTPFNVNSILPGELAAVEFYRGLSNTPVELQGRRNSCGVLVLWTVQ